MAKTQFYLRDDTELVKAIDRLAEMVGCSRNDIYRFAARQFLARVDEAGTAEYELLAPLRAFLDKALPTDRED